MKLSHAIRCGLGLLAFLFATPSQARSFYKATFKMSVQYADIKDGKKDLLNDLKVNVRYSDDHDFCEVVIGPDSFECHSYHPDDQPGSVMITMDRGVGGQVVAAALANSKCDQALLQKFQRLATYLDDTIDIEWQGDDFYQQIHDEQPESFHVWLFEMSEGTVY